MKFIDFLENDECITEIIDFCRKSTIVQRISSIFLKNADSTTEIIDFLKNQNKTIGFLVFRVVPSPILATLSAKTTILEHARFFRFCSKPFYLNFVMIFQPPLLLHFSKTFEKVKNESIVLRVV